MPRKATEAELLEKERMKIIHDKQVELNKRAANPPIRRTHAQMPGELALKKRMAIIRKIADPGLSYSKIAGELGEPRTAVKNWFAEPEVKEEYEFLLRNLSTTTLEALRNYGLEALLTLVTLMRFGSEKMMFDSAIAILDRMGIAKLTKVEQTREETTTHNFDFDEILNAMRDLPEDQKEEAAKGIEKLGQLLEQAANKNAT